MLSARLNQRTFVTITLYELPSGSIVPLDPDFMFVLAFMARSFRRAVHSGGFSC